MSGIYRKGVPGKCDLLFSKIVRARGYCEKCGSTENLQTAHIVSRKYSNTRCDVDNAWCLCARDHRLLTDEPYLHVAYAVQTRGEDGYARLREKARSTAKVDWAALLVELRAHLAAIEAAA